MTLFGTNYWYCTKSSKLGSDIDTSTGVGLGLLLVLIMVYIVSTPQFVPQAKLFFRLARPQRATILKVCGYSLHNKTNLWNGISHFALHLQAETGSTFQREIVLADSELLQKHTFCGAVQPCTQRSLGNGPEWLNASL